MEQRLLTVGLLGAYRSKPTDPTVELQRVRVIAPPRARQVKLRHEDGELAGFEEWLPTRTVMCPWRERKAFLRDEAAERALKAASAVLRDHVIVEAISTVMAATGEEGGFMHTWDVDPERLQRLWRRARLDTDPLSEPHAYVDRHGRIHLTSLTALKFAQAFAAAEPEPCLLEIRASEQQLRAEGYAPGDQFAHDLLRQYAPSYALIRDWASRDEASLLRDEIQRLRGVVELAIDLLNKAGADLDAGRVRLALKGR